MKGVSSLLATTFCSKAGSSLERGLRIAGLMLTRNGGLLALYVFAVLAVVGIMKTPTINKANGWVRRHEPAGLERVLYILYVIMCSSLLQLFIQLSYI